MILINYGFICYVFACFMRNHIYFALFMCF